MAIPAAKKAYYFTNGASNKRLNLYSSGSASNGMNVVLYTKDTSNEQVWVVNDNRLNILTKPNYNIERASTNNADIIYYDNTKDASQRIVFETLTGGKAVRIKLFGTSLYLTAVNHENGTGSGKTSESDGNVYWRTIITQNPELEQYQHWYFTQASMVGKGNGSLAVGNTPTTLNYTGGCYTSFSKGQCTWHAFGRALEVKGKIIRFSANSGLDGQAWYDKVTNCTKLDNNDPRSNSIAVWRGGPNGEGHVAYIEKYSGGYIYMTEANVGGTNGVVKKKTLSDITTYLGSLSLRGFLLV